MKRILVTGAAGFIGFHLSKRLVEEGYCVYGIDNMNGYYDISLKEDRIRMLNTYQNFKFDLISIEDDNLLRSLFSKEKFSFVFHMAAQAGIRYSFENPQAYIDTNINGFSNILELCRKSDSPKLFYASSSSVYGDSKRTPFTEDENSINPISFYGLTKKINEELAHMYYNVFRVNSIGLRFFTVYGPWGRPDMALFKFTRKIINNETIQIYNNGEHRRAFTYIDDIISSIILLFEKYRYENKFHDIVNIGGDTSISLMKFVKIIENAINMKAKIEFLDLQKGDVKDTSSSCKKLNSLIGFTPKISLEKGIVNFIDWYKDYNNLS